MSNESLAAVVFILWMVTGRELNLCLVIFFYYLLYSTSGFDGVQSYFIDSATVYVTYYSQTCFDVIALVSTLALSLKYQELVRIYLLYSCIIASSAVLNAAMLVDQTLDMNWLYSIHAFRQELSAPIDLLFAVLGSSKGGQIIRYTHRSLLTAHRSVYNRINRFSNHNASAEK